MPIKLYHPQPRPKKFDIYHTLMPERTFSVSELNCTFGSVFILLRILFFSLLLPVFLLPWCHHGIGLQLSPTLCVAECS